jgi:ribonuclease HII
MLKSYYNKILTEAGCDEAGRGALAGPVVAAAVILPKRFRNRELNDSKKLTEKQRDRLRELIIKSAVAWNVAFIDNDEIDHINILKASIKAMHLAIDGLSIPPQLLLIDGNRFYQYRDIPHKTIIKGDGFYMSIAAASVLAKTYRDDYMKKIHNEFPQYGWNNNKGYPTEAHRRSIREYGITLHHRKSFSLYELQLSIDF